MNVFFTAVVLFGATTDTVAQRIMWQVYHRPSFRDMHAQITMTLMDPNGTQRVRKMETWSKKDPKTDETKMLIKFTEPADLRGTAFLIYQHKDREDDMWFYLPALRKTKRLAASGKSGAFMGSDFSNYDIGGGEYEDWKYQLIKEEELDGTPCWVIEALPKSPEVEKKSGYSKEIRWVNQANYVVIRTDHYDRSGMLFKRTLVKDVVQIKGVWFERVIEATDLDSGHHTVMEFSNIVANQGLPDDLFSIRALGR